MTCPPKIEPVAKLAWKWKNTERITEAGTTESFVFTGNGYPMEYYFTQDSVWIFRYYQDRNLRQCTTFRYDETENLVESPGIAYMQICSLDSLRMMTIEHAGYMGYLVNHYERMMPFELNARMLGFEHRCLGVRMDPILRKAASMAILTNS